MVSSKNEDLQTLIDLTALPTAPFCEQHVIEYIHNFSKSLKNITFKKDPAGNILIRYKHPATGQQKPLAFNAHMDHPGFMAEGKTRLGKQVVRWHGSVPVEFFKNSRVRFYSEGEWLGGKIFSFKTKKTGPRKIPRVNTLEITMDKPTRLKKGTLGMWDLGGPKIKGSKIYSRVMDDLAGCSAMLDCLSKLSAQNIETHILFLFTRAEEVGFVGTIEACHLKTIPKGCAIITLETSSVLPGVKIGGGPILRVGDASSTYCPETTGMLKQSVQDLQKKDPTFKFQRKLMDGGTCEASAFYQMGYRASGLCLALGNYHNCDKVRKKIASEYVDINDYRGLVKLLVEICKNPKVQKKGNPNFKKALDKIRSDYHELLFDRKF